MTPLLLKRNVPVLVVKDLILLAVDHTPNHPSDARGHDPKETVSMLSWRMRPVESLQDPIDHEVVAEVAVEALVNVKLKPVNRKRRRCLFNFTRWHEFESSTFTLYFNTFKERKHTSAAILDIVVTVCKKSIHVGEKNSSNSYQQSIVVYCDSISVSEALSSLSSKL
jgi:hypothetical protein